MEKGTKNIVKLSGIKILKFRGMICPLCDSKFISQEDTGLNKVYHCHACGHTWVDN